MVKVGLTGGIGSGKTTVAKVFEILGVPVYYADDAAKKLMQEDKGIQQKILQLFGTGAYDNGILNRSFISQKVFNDPAQLALLNNIVHPATIKDAADWMLKQTAPYCIKEAALIFESKSHINLDYVIGVYAPVPLRIQRVMQRDHSSEEQIMKRMNEQMNEEEKIRLCQYVITNDEAQLIIPQILNIHRRLLQKRA